MIDTQTLFDHDENGYHTSRIPSLLTAANGDLLAICEGRRGGRGDANQIDLVLRRSTDDGRTWSEPTIVVSEAGMTCGNPCPVLDRHTGQIILLFCKNREGDGLVAVRAGDASRTIWLTRSTDHGDTWSPPTELTPQVKKNVWTWYATGPGHGLQLADGRLIIPCNHLSGIFRDKNDLSHSHLIYSDDHGETWQIGAILSFPGNESRVVEGDDGSVYLNCRTNKTFGRRSFGISHDRGLSFAEEGFHDELIESTKPSGGCQGSLLKLPPVGPQKSLLLFCNPATAESERKRLTIHASDDHGRTWHEVRVIHEGLAGYSDLALLSDGRIACLHETGDDYYAERLELKTFTRDWLFAESNL